MTYCYSPESPHISDDPVEILLFAAEHIEYVGLHQGRGLFAGPGHTTLLPCWLRGAVDVGAGKARVSLKYDYDWAAIGAGQDMAYRILAEYLAGGPVDAPDGDPEFARVRHRMVMDLWSSAPGRTTLEAACALREATRSAQAKPGVGGLSEATRVG